MSDATGQPRMEPYSRHMIVCTGRFCSPEGKGRALYARLAELLEREDLLFGPGRVKRSEAPCLGVCEGGPVAVVYPEGLWYGHVDLALLQRIVREHLRHGRPIDAHVFHRLGSEPPNEPPASTG
ncbi:MAG: (2Fe-2S) ferredoxin domain-containing protein [Gemmatimonadaceae bacterium]